MTVKHQADLVFENGQYFVTGQLDFFNVTLLLEKSLQSVNPLQPFIVNFSRLSAGNSAVIALMVEWLKLADKMHVKAKFIDLPEKVISILKAAGMEDLVLSQ